MVFDQILGVFGGENVAFFSDKLLDFLKSEKKLVFFDYPPSNFTIKYPEIWGLKGTL